MLKTTERQGEIIIAGEAILWSFFPVVTGLTFSRLSPLLSLAWSVIFAAIFFAALLTIRKKWREISNISAFKDIVWVTIFIGLLHYGLVFTGLQYTSAGNASIIALVEIFWSFLFFNVWQKENIARAHIAGALLMIIGAGIILFGDFTGGFNKGDILILIGMAAAPIGNYFQQKARLKVSSETIMFVRSALAAPILLLVGYLLHNDMSLLNVKQSLLFLMINGFLLLGLSKIFWLEAIIRISVVKALSLSSMSPLLTLLTVYLFFGKPPEMFQILSFIPMFFGVFLLVREPRLRSEK